MYLVFPNSGNKWANRMKLLRKVLDYSQFSTYDGVRFRNFRQSSSAAKSGGCFPGRNLVRTENGSTRRLDRVQLGERVAVSDSNGEIVYSEVIAFLDCSLTERREFFQLTTESGRVLALAPARSVPVEGRSSVFAGRVQSGDKILVRDSAYANEVEHRLRWNRVVNNRLVLDGGIYAPLTTEGTVLMDDVVATCYAFVDNNELAHFAFLPYGMWSSAKKQLLREEAARCREPEVHGC